MVHSLLGAPNGEFVVVERYFQVLSFSLCWYINQLDGAFMKRVLAVAIALAMSGIAHADPTIDGSNPRYFDRSLEEIRASLDETEVERFDEAVEALLMRRSQQGLTIVEISELSDDELEAMATEARRSLHGLSGQEVLELAGELPK